MKVTYDLHIHSGLSPCAEPEMTPNNIVNMAVIKELDFIAICDHNAILNVSAALEVVNRDGLPIVVIPGIEVQTKEDVHLICLFRTYQQLRAFYEDIIPHLQKIPHNAKRFGDQMLFDAEDNWISSYDWSLYASIQLSVDDIVERVLQYEGDVIPAHVDRGSYSIVSNLGFISPDLPIKVIEFSPEGSITSMVNRHPALRKYKHIINSDAHELIQISEAIHTLEVSEKTVNAFFEALFTR